MRNGIVRRVQALAVVRISDHRCRAVKLVTHNAASQMLARNLAALVVEGVAIAVVRRHAEYADATIVLQPPQLSIVGDVAPDQIMPLSIPGRALRPERAGPEPLDRRIGLAQTIETRIHCQHVRIREVGRRRAPRTEIPRWSGHRAGRRYGCGLSQRLARGECDCSCSGDRCRDQRPP